MTYVITDHNNQNFVILGPIEWKPNYIANVLTDELQVDITVTKDDQQRVPYEILPGVKVRRCQSTYDDINPKIQGHQGPVWTYDDSSEIQATAHWFSVDLPINQVKSSLKAQLANLRWQKENTGIELLVQNTQVWCDTSRGNRDIFLQTYSIMNDNENIRWKFPNNIWLDLTKNELGYIVSEGAKYIQSCFDWEATQAAIVDACQTLNELDQLTFEE